MSKLGRLFLIAGLCAVFFLMLVAAIVGNKVVQSTKTDDLIAKLKSKGVPVSVSELKSNIQDSQNAATLYKPIIKQTSSNASYRDFSDLRDFISPKNGIITSSQIEGAKKIVAKYTKVFPEVELAVKRPKCRYPVNWDKSNPLEITFPHLIGLRNTGLLLAAKAEIDTNRGNANAAIHDIDLLYKVSESLKDEPTLVPQMVRRSIVYFASSALRYTMKNAYPSEKSIADLANTVSHIDLYPGFTKGLEGEMCIGLSYIDYLAKPKSKFEKTHDSDDIAESFRQSRPTRAHIAFLNANKRVVLEYLDKYTDVSHMSYRDIKLRNPDILSYPNLPKYAVVAVIAVPSLGLSLPARDECAADISGTMIFLKLQIFKAEYGRYPSNLNELSDKLHFKLPVDPFSGKNFVYKTNEKGFCLYSIGKNMKDDGGDDKSEGRGCNMTYHKDIIWKM